MNNYLEILRPGINTTFQDLGRNNFYHIGLPFSGAMDKRNFKICNKLLDNNYSSAVIEFAYQGPSFRYVGEKNFFAVTGDANFVIKKNNSQIIEGKCYKIIEIENNDIIDISSTNKTVYGYISFVNGFILKSFLGSHSTTTRAQVGPNDGQKFRKDQKIFLNETKNIQKKKINFLNSKIEYIRIIKGTNFNYFSDEAISLFLSMDFTVSKLSDRMGMRLEGPKIKNLKKTNIKSEGLVKGVIQVPADGNPIIMLSDHGTIGGYPKLGVVISADYDKLVQLPSNSKIKFKLIELEEAENLFKIYELETQNILNNI